MNPAYEKLLKCYDSYKAKIDFTPKVALILGSGLGDYADDIRVVDTLDYHDIEGFPVSTVPGHKGRFIFGYVDDVPVVCMQGRVHYYEGYEMSDVVLPTRLMKMMGAEVLFLTNAAGGIQLGMHAGDFMLIKDQIASFVPSPLRGANIEELGVRFPDMSQIYDLDLQDIVKRAASALEIRIKEGTYIQLRLLAFQIYLIRFQLVFIRLQLGLLFFQLVPQRQYLFLGLFVFLQFLAVILVDALHEVHPVQHTTQATAL